MHTFVTELKKEAKALKTSPTKLIKASGFSDANWYNWTGNRSKPSEIMQEQIRKTIAAVKVKVPVQAVDDSHTVPSASAGKKTLNQLRNEKQTTVAKLQADIAAIDALMV